MAQVWTTSAKQKFAFLRKTCFLFKCIFVDIEVSANTSPSRKKIACDERLIIPKDLVIDLVVRADRHVIASN